MVDTCTVTWTARDFQFASLGAARLVFIPRDALALAGAAGVLYVPARAEATSDGSGVGSIALVPGYYILRVITADGTATAGVAVPDLVTAPIGSCIDHTLDLPALSEFQALAIAAQASADAAAASALAAATFTPSLYLDKAGNLAGIANSTTALTNLGGTAVGRAVFTGATGAAARTALGSTAVGDAIFAAATATAARTTLGATAVGDAVFIAATAVAAQTALGGGATGRTLFGAATTAAARTAIGASATGDALIVAPDAAAGRTALAAAPLAAPAFTGQVSVPLGSAAAPSIIPAGDPNTGLYSPGADLLSVALGGTERLRLDAGYLRLTGTSGGIQFNGDTAAANALNDYEEGNWTPVIAGSTVAGTGTYTAQLGTYVKVGKLVFISCTLVWTAHTGTGSMLVTGMPFAASSTKVSGLIISASLTLPASSFALIEIQTSQILVLSQVVGGSGASQLAMDTAATIGFSAVYSA